MKTYRSEKAVLELDHLSRPSRRDSARMIYAITV